MNAAGQPQSARLTIAGEAVELLPQRAAWWPSRRTLIVADLHLGKCETLRAHGIPVPAGVLERDLLRLADVASRTRAARILIVGDLLHHASGLTPEVIDSVAALRARALSGVDLALIRGNHDRAADRIIRDWRITPLPDAYLDGPFGFAHDPADGPVAAAACTWFGHVHPLCRVGGRGDGVSIPCFKVHCAQILLPAFSLFTRGVAIRHDPKSRVFGIADNHVLEIPALPHRLPRRPEPAVA